MWRPHRPDWVVRRRYQRKLRRSFQGKQPILVFSLSKVGTTSLASAIRTATARPVLQCHRVAPSAPDERWRDGRGRPYVRWRGELAAEIVGGGEWEVVCGVRDPIARAVSALFQTGQWDEVESTEAMVGDVSELFRSGRGELRWFQEQLEQVTGIDVYAEPFDSASGWQAYTRSRFRVLLLRFEDLDKAPPALAKFFGLSVAPALPHLNDSRTDSYANRYASFRARAALPGDVLDIAYGSAVAQHFYTDTERRAFRSVWGQEQTSPR